MKIILCLLLGLIDINATPVESDIPAVEPEYLDQLRDEGRYEEFSALLGIPDPKLAVERKTGGRSELSIDDAMMHEELEGGDMLPSATENEEGRQGIRFDKYPGSKWQNREVPYEISGDFNANQRGRIQVGINHWNEKLGSCLKLVPRNGQTDYVYVFSGNGCYSFVGRRGKQQSLSLQKNGCLSRGTVVHEFEHAVGFTHEHNRHDRDKFVEVLWKNIPRRWQSQYRKVNPNDFNNVNTYDYYSVMHYPYYAPGTRKAAFRIIQNGIDQNRLGRGNEFTPTDIAKIKEQYGCS